VTTWGAWSPSWGGTRNNAVPATSRAKTDEGGAEAAAEDVTQPVAEAAAPEAPAGAAACAEPAATSAASSALGKLGGIWDVVDGIEVGTDG